MPDLPPADLTLDERGRRCPLPVIALSRSVLANPGAVIAVHADDPAAEFDIPAWCRLKGAEFLGAEDDLDGARRYLVRAPGNAG